METHRRLAPCPAALEDRELGPSTGIEEEIEEREVCGHDRGGRREAWSLGHLAACTGATLWFSYVSIQVTIGPQMFNDLLYFLLYYQHL